MIGTVFDIQTISIAKSADIKVISKFDAYLFGIAKFLSTYSSIFEYVKEEQFHSMNLQDVSANSRPSNLANDTRRSRKNEAVGIGINPEDMTAFSTDIQ